MLSPWDTHHVSLQVRYPWAGSMIQALMLIVDTHHAFTYTPVQHWFFYHTHVTCEPKTIVKWRGVLSNVGLVYMRMHGIINQHQ